MMIKLDEGIIFTGLATFSPWPIFFMARMLMRDLFALVDRFVK